MNKELLKGLSYAGYYDETEKYIIEIDISNALELMKRINKETSDTEEMKRIIAEKFEADIVIITK